MFFDNLGDQNVFLLEGRNFFKDFFFSKKKSLTNYLVKKILKLLKKGLRIQILTKR